MGMLVAKIIDQLPEIPEQQIYSAASLALEIWQVNHPPSTFTYVSPLTTKLHPVVISRIHLPPPGRPCPP
jgi:hypothetical protein